MWPDGEQDVEGLKVGFSGTSIVILCSWTLCASGLLLFTKASNWSRLFLCSDVRLSSWPCRVNGRHNSSVGVVHVIIHNNYPAAKFDLTATLEKDSIIVKQL